MSLAITSRPVATVTPEWLLRHARDGRYELVDGELSDKPWGPLAGRVSGRICGRVGSWVEAHALGETVVGMTFQCFPDRPDRVRRPDIAFIAASRATAIGDEGHVRIRPDFVVEILSTTDDHREVDRRVTDYRTVGVRLQWVVNPAVRTVQVIRLDGSGNLLYQDDLLDGGDVLPGFSVRVGEFFPPAGGATERPR